MKNRLKAIVLTAAAALGLCGCGRRLDTEYVVETSYAPVLSAADPVRVDTTVASLEDLKQVLLDMVAEGTVIRGLLFDPAYAGDVNADLASACWQVRTQDALCAYCVENIAYDVSKIVNRYEALISVAYSKTAADRERIVPLPYVADAGELLRQAMRDGQDTLVLLIEHSSHTAEDMVDFTREVYREQPGLAPREPAVTVEITSGAETQRLYEIHLDYGLDPAEFAARQGALDAFDLLQGVDPVPLTEAERALFALCALTVRCRGTDDPAAGSIYDALIGCEADSRGMALAYVELCRRLGLSCQLVEGQHNRAEHCWTIVQIDGEYYHVDPQVCDASGLASGFLLSDEVAWGAWRWDYFAYPHCAGELNAAAVSYSGTAGGGKQNLPENEITP